MVNKSSWNVVCTGNIKPYFTQDMVIDNIQELFKFNREKASTLIQGSASVVKKGIEYQAALYYQQVLDDAGVETRLEETLLEKHSEAAKLSLDALSLAPLEGGYNHRDAHEKGEFICPECHKQQPKTLRCVDCGAVIDKRSQNNNATAQDPARNEPFQQTPSRSQASYLRNDNEEKETIFEKIKENKQYLFIVIALFVIVKLVFLNDSVYQDIGNSPEALAEIATLANSSNYPKPDPIQLRGLLRSEQYAQLESKLKTLSNNVNDDINWEGAFVNAIIALSDRDKVTLNMLNNWVKSTQSANAYLARGSFYVNEGVAARGSRSLSKTSSAQLSAMNDLYLLAYDDLIKAKSIDNSLLPTYALLIQINVGDGSTNPRDDFLNEAIAVNPAGNQYRYIYMFYNRPIWGGSWDIMSNFAEASAQYISLNPRLNLLFGYIPAEKGHIALANKDLNKCISYYSEALQYGIQGEWLRHRAYCLYDNKEYEKALKDINLFFTYFDYASDYDKKLKRYLSNKVK